MISTASISTAFLSTKPRPIFFAGLTLLLAVLFASLLGPSPALAQEEAAEKPLWSGGLGFAYLSTSGNSDTETLGVDLDVKRRPTPWGLAIKAQFDRAEENEALTAERYFAGVRGTRQVSERWDVFVGASGEQDEFAGLDLRTLVEAGGVYHALLGPEHVLDFDLGLTWTDEDRLPPAPDVDSFGALAGLAYEWTISENASFSQRILYYPNFDESDDWRLDSTTALTSSLTSSFALKLSYDVRYRNQPIGDSDDTDTSTKVSLVWKL